METIPPKLFPAFWETLKIYLRERTFILPEIAFQEVLEQDDDLSQIIKEYTNRIQEMNREILNIQT